MLNIYCSYTLQLRFDLSSIIQSDGHFLHFTRDVSMLSSTLSIDIPLFITQLFATPHKIHFSDDNHWSEHLQLNKQLKV